MLRIVKIIISKSRTISTDSVLGRDAFRKITIGAEAEISEGEDALAAKDELIAFIDLALAEQVSALNAEAKSLKKGI